MKMIFSCSFTMNWLSIVSKLRVEQTVCAGWSLLWKQIQSEMRKVNQTLIIIIIIIYWTYYMKVTVITYLLLLNPIQLYIIQWIILRCRHPLLQRRIGIKTWRYIPVVIHSLCLWSKKNIFQNDSFSI